MTQKISLKLSIILALFLFSACETPEDIDKTEEIVALVSELNNCEITYKIDSTDVGNRIILSFVRSTEKDLLPGKVIHDIYVEFLKNDIEYDAYKVELTSGWTLEVSNAEMQLVMKKKKFFKEKIEIVYSKDPELVFGMFVEHMRNDISSGPEIMSKKLERLVDGRYDDFEGFEVELFGGDERFVAFRNSNGKSSINILFWMGDDKDDVYGLQIEGANFHY